jgi:uncharacterized protein (TIGR00299 family) protein
VKIAYLDCASGISGDMTLGALVDAGVDLEKINAGIASLNLPGVRLTAAEVKKKGFRATQITVEHQPEHAHRHLHHIVKLIDESQLSPSQQDVAKRIFQCIGEAEAKVHGTTLQKIHFHEVGAVDSIADICGAAIGFDLLGVDRIVASPVPTGSGAITIAHGRCSVPAPATAEMLRGIPLADSSVQAELTTPTGAAILATLVDAYGPLPAMTIDRIGYGAGQRELKEQANMLRLIVGETADDLAADQAWVVETNLDDISGEVIGYCTTKLWEAGALDVYTTAIQMKKNRPGVTLTVLCRPEQIAKIEKIVFKETSTLGVRRWPVSRHKLERKAHTVETEFGPILGKLGWVAGQQPSFAPEFDSCSRVATERGVPLKAVYEAAQKAFDPAAAG